MEGRREGGRRRRRRRKKIGRRRGEKINEGGGGKDLAENQIERRKEEIKEGRKEIKEINTTKGIDDRKDQKTKIIEAETSKNIGWKGKNNRERKEGTRMEGNRRERKEGEKGGK